ncbi:ionotropic receptor 21a [Nilaparvata lugens]|uniref:ionotropic receptor 21a n=1 Tax=Nilaparvata lugens TaxID=108931 RepID=UPI00193D3BE7|nr:ionotropic receptor 21a [Nilaparvata lugens]
MFTNYLSLKVIIEQLLKTYPYPSVHGRLLITGRSMKVKGDIIKKRREQKCNNFVLLTKELEMVSDVLGKQPESRIIIVPLTSLWQLSSFLTSPISQNLVNMLILFDPSLTVEGLEARNNSKDITIYTHLLFTDSMGATVPKVMTVWRCDRLTQPKLNLFPNKFQSGFNGYRFRLSGAQQPPFVFRKKNQQSKSNADERITTWDGYEVRLLQLVSEALNFTFKIEEPADSGNASDRRVIKEVRNLRADIAIAGIPATADRMNEFSFSTVHSYDCANFITLTSTALPKYRAILGPFRLEVWICLILIYLFAIIPISFSARHTLKHLLEDPWEIENMFWYVFGTFTNCFTFIGRGSWTSGKHNATRLFVGTYWVFTIIITAAYTGCIIAFITLPAYPPVLDTAQQLLKANYRIGILNGSGWQAAFENSSDKVTDRLLKKADFVPNLALGLKNVSKAVYWKPYAFLGSKEEMKFMINTNYTPSSRHKKSLFHLSKECFVPLMVSAVFSKDAIYKHPLDVTIMRVIQSGLFMKLSRDVEWDQYRASTGKLMQVGSVI